MITWALLAFCLLTAVLAPPLMPARRQPTAQDLVPQRWTDCLEARQDEISASMRETGRRVDVRPLPCGRDGYRPLLPRQRAVAERLAEEERTALAAAAPVEDLPRRDGTIIEPLPRRRHHPHGGAQFHPRSVPTAGAS